MSSERHFQTKLVRIKNSRGKQVTRRILLQNENGPCPLLAIFNTLILRGDRFINQFKQHKAIIVSSKDLSVILANRLMAVNKKGLNTTIENLNRNINDSIDVIPRMIQGLDINVKFDNIYCFEYTPELGLFDVLRIPLVHAWVVDPEDNDLYSSIGTLSYNQAVEKQIHMTEVLEEIERENRLNEELEKNKKKSSPPENRLVKKTVLFEKTKKKKKEKKINSEEEGPKNIFELLNIKQEEEPKKNEDWIVVDKDEEEKMGFEDDDDDFPFAVEMEADGDNEESEGSIPLGSLRFEIEIPQLDEDNKNNKKKNTRNVVHQQEEEERNNRDEEEDRTTLHNSNIDPLPFPPNHIDHSNEPLDDEIIELERKIQETRIENERNRRKIEKERENVLREGRIVKKFLNSTGDQMTYFGIEQLHMKLKKGRLYVLFRNHHFSTILKHTDGYIYMLCNDVGYVNKPGVVWERLTDQEFFDGDFKVYVEKEDKIAASIRKNQKKQKMAVDVGDTSNARNMKDGVIHKVVNIPGSVHQQQQKKNKKKKKKSSQEVEQNQVGDITIKRKKKNKKNTELLEQHPLEDPSLSTNNNNKKKKVEEEEEEEIKIGGLVLDPLGKTTSNQHQKDREEMDRLYAQQLFEEEMRKNQRNIESDFEMAKRLQAEERRRMNEQMIAQRHFDDLGRGVDGGNVHPEERNFGVQRGPTFNHRHRDARHPRHNNNWFEQQRTNNRNNEQFLTLRDREIARMMENEDTANQFRNRVNSKMMQVRAQLHKYDVNPRQQHLVQQHMQNQREKVEEESSNQKKNQKNNNNKKKKKNNNNNNNKNKNKKQKKKKVDDDETTSLMFQDNEEEEILLADHAQMREQKTKRQKKEEGKCSIM